MTASQKNSEKAPAAAAAPGFEQSLARLGVTAESLPRHVAIIMDGNGRWARAQGKPRIFGHEQGAANVRQIVTECAALRLDMLTLYAFSTENWLRSRSEVDFLMDLLLRFLAAERQTMMQNNVRFMPLGRREGLDKRVLEEVDRTQRDTAGNTGLTLALAINYGARAEITDAVRAIAEKVQRGELRPGDIEPETISAHLYTAGHPDPDLLIRTAAEMRISNFLLWQISYAELYVTDVCWPQFSVEELHKALRAYAHRTRKFGDVPAPGK
ncbi:MAG: isoprenyl transferase [Phycisphaeraceae bacterium]|nr:isoprenyl transferase [Phycisphaeraceae bacterium]